MNESRDEFVTRMREKLEEWNMGLDELQSRVDLADAGTKSDQEERVIRLRREFEATRNRLSSVESLGPDEWEDFRKGMEEARQLLDEGLEEARSARENKKPGAPDN